MDENVFMTSVYKTCTMLAILLVITRFKISKKMLHRDKYSKGELVFISIMFAVLASLTNYIPLKVYGTTVPSIRVIIVSGGILFGSLVGISSSIITSMHLFIIDRGCPLLIPEILSIITAGILSGAGYELIKKFRINEKYKWILGTLVGIIVQLLSLVYSMKTIQFLYPDAIYKINDLIRLNNLTLLTQLPIGIFVVIIYDIQNERVQLMNLSKMEQLKSELAKSKLMILQSQINPHFLFNTLNTIGMLTKINPGEARNLIVRLSKYIRYNLELKGGLIDINEELEQVKCYVDIQKSRFKEEFEVFYYIDENIDIKIPSLIIQPLVENALEHGILKSRQYGEIYVSVKKEGLDKINISIENTGIQIDEKIIKNIYNDSVEDNKVGLYNVHIRLKLMYGKGLNITRLDNGTRIDFNIGGMDERDNSGR